MKQFAKHELGVKGVARQTWRIPTDQEASVCLCHQWRIWQKESTGTKAACLFPVSFSEILKYKYTCQVGLASCMHSPLHMHLERNSYGILLFHIYFSHFKNIPLFSPCQKLCPYCSLTLQLMFPLFSSPVHSVHLIHAFIPCFILLHCFIYSSRCEKHDTPTVCLIGLTCTSLQRSFREVNI